MLFALVFPYLSVALTAPVVTEQTLSPADQAWVQNLVKNKEAVIERYQREAAELIKESAHNQESINGCPAKCAKKTDFLSHNSKGELRGDKEVQDEERYPHLLIFVSFSMPLETLKSFAQQAIRVGGKLVFRGLVGGSFHQMAQKMKALGTEALIDPTLFSDYEIKKVPVIVVREKDHYDRVDGNITLISALEMMAHQGECAELAGEFLKRLKEGPR